MTELAIDTLRTVGPADAIPNDFVVPYYLEDRKLRISVARVDDRLYAFDDLCTCADRTCPLSGGLLTGTLTALLAVLPALSSRGGHISILSWTLLLPGVLLTGLAASFVAVAAVTRLPVLATLRSE